MKRLLCIDGGGIRGLVPAIFLERLEHATSRSIAQQFDLISGTSTGGLLALGLTVPNADRSGPRHRASDLRRLYEERTDLIFPQRWWQGVTGFFQPRYSADGLREVVREYMGDARISESVTPVVIPAFNRTHGEDAVFKTTAQPDWYARDAALATSAAPTFFPAHDATSLDNSVSASFVDGGIWANNPVLCAYAEARLKWSEERIEIVSLGTGHRRQENLGPAEGGLIQWVRALADLFMDAGERGIDYQIRAFTQARDDTYRRIQADVPAHIGTDTTDAKTLELLASVGHSLADEHLGRIAV